MSLPLEGIRIIEFGQLIAIPHATKLLGDMGAEIIRIESCGRLDVYRTTSLYANDTEGHFWDRAANFYEQNRNKMSLTLDVTKSEGLEALRELVAISDVFAENYTPRVMRNFRLEYEDLRQIRPDIIMVSSTGYGYTGPWANYGAIGFTTEAASGLAHLTGYKGDAPVLPEIPYADYTAAEHTAFAIMSALIHRARTGEGQFIDVSQSETLTSTIPEAMLDYSVNGRTGERIGNQDETLAPHGVYPCEGDDSWLVIAVETDAQWQALCAVLGKPELSSDDRFSNPLSRWHHRDELDKLVGSITAQWEQHQLMHALQEKGVPAGAVLNGKQLLLDPHLKERDFYEIQVHQQNTGMPPLPYTSKPWKFADGSGGARTAAPTLGQHNEFVLAEFLGKTSAEIGHLEKDGVIGDTATNLRTPRKVSLEEQRLRGQIYSYEDDFQEQLKERFPS